MKMIEIIKRILFRRDYILYLISFLIFTVYGQSLDSKKTLFFISCFNDSLPDSLVYKKPIKFQFKEYELLKPINDGKYYEYQRYDSRELKIVCRAKTIKNFDTASYEILSKNKYSSYIYYNSFFEKSIRDLVEMIDNDTAIQNNNGIMLYYDSIITDLEKKHFERIIKYDFFIESYYKKNSHFSRNKGSLIFVSLHNIVEVEFRIRTKNRRYWNKYSYKEICSKLLDKIINVQSLEFENNGYYYIYDIKNKVSEIKN